MIAEHPEVVRSIAGSGVTGVTAFVGWTATNTPMLQGVSLLISIAVGAATLAYTVIKIWKALKGK